MPYRHHYQIDAMYLLCMRETLAAQLNQDGFTLVLVRLKRHEILQVESCPVFNITVPPSGNPRASSFEHRTAPAFTL